MASNGFSGDGGPATSAKLNRPESIAVDTQGNIYIADVYNERIRKVTPDGIITTVAGTGRGSFPGYLGDGGPATSADLVPRAVAVDTQGNIYIADMLFYRLRRVSTDGKIDTVPGNGEQVTTTTLIDIFGIAVDTQGNIYMAFHSDSRIYKLTTDGIITTIAGNGTIGFSGDGGPATSAALQYPNGVAVDTQGNIYIFDQSERIRKVSTCVPPITHAECSKLACVQVSGAGPNICSTDLHCRQCLDSDGGNKPGIGGMVLIIKNRRFQKFPDQCREIKTAQMNLKYLTEFYCENGRLKSQTYSCRQCSKAALSPGWSCTQ
ncbi:MAG: hypothetical protein A3F82_09360 [Deltaproteobacteria bacterium RIFCSPLOWO2_12_FULL_44_12]|nr:MAG: hypothetical protein A2712_06270 [Deltaproteobacteria bacterium RIFCSPHIGHO2_01_FULL_43_49]OGQ16732.1 MAG: hypothetical protein A3D22_07395 [Deltaproteobacteria bacterium RIFCSPHIGHO2_02_FULL_44_53]OGQ29870.1 MAG: hypothetical protein A3D98_10060 [Deltaproteobacteria bacterium RIFCSPHIGHO2_12_FULL_44_21]OGQ33160.1 MAG: hypothetical protein A2979_04040 [Deltaproteobacteria bacterium RIFCSPLOWO2_01_FULL_45_74]OGQ42255.1 MAG: hypothetical protein A3I70_06345 [Deltaproteobacteria bacterium 